MQVSRICSLFVKVVWFGFGAPTQHRSYGAKDKSKVKRLTIEMVKSCVSTQVNCW